ncbi:Flavodoxin protein [Marine Group I thaumarchaeote SCGC RSA3]|uniref:Flavodoxin-2 protein n=3 Tax=Marine Group I TaxID=905826 RepID=A0A081RML2_9ARCH|nr:Flavodoxin-2 protein [Marine Group I thaumarchaeote SCGC AAA799-N04]KFM15414.1 Flavodoxin-2 protein [Marine Group I thaumarchaeote SCGC AAA799-D11]KFM16606.1 Flavodoxin protein [Marine Group I thaumarchaeote SCGC RSA3]
MAIGIYFGSQTGKTEMVCAKIKSELGDAATDPKDVSEIGGDPSQFTEMDGIICAIPTWNTGEEQNRSGTAWDDLLEKIGELDLKGKPVAICGLGDAAGYADNFVDAMEELHRYFEKAGAKMVGYVSTDGYNFTGSKSVINGKFCGLPVDEDSESEHTDDRVTQWCSQLKSEMGL